MIANGSWMGQISKLLGIRIPMQPGKGYSVVYKGLSRNLQFPSILVDDRTATTPIGDWLRIGGTMELSGHSDNILPKRVEALYTGIQEILSGDENPGTGYRIGMVWISARYARWNALYWRTSQVPQPLLCRRSRHAGRFSRCRDRQAH